MGLLIGYNVVKPSELIVEKVGFSPPEYPRGTYIVGSGGGYVFTEEEKEEIKIYDDYHSRLKSNELPAEQRPLFEEASKLGMTHWTYLEEEHYYYWVAFNVGEQPICEPEYDEYDREEDNVRENAPRTQYDHCFICLDGELIEVTLPSWEKRDRVNSTESALKCLVAFLGENTFLDEKKQKEAQEFADKWNIPFNCDLHTKFIDMWTELHPRWNSSAAYC